MLKKTVLHFMLSTALLHFSYNSYGTEVVGGFEGSNIYNINKISDNYFTCEMKPDEPSRFRYPDHNGYWFYLKIIGAKDQAITIDITNCDWYPGGWDSYKPVFSYASDPNDLSDHNWQKIENTSRSGITFSFTYTYEADTVWVALRYPYMYTYMVQYLDVIRDNPYVTVESLTKTTEGRDLYAVTITDTTIRTPKKGIFIFARDHASEQDGSWLCEGIIEFLLSDDPIADALRKNTVFLIVPIVKPDASFYGRTVDLLYGLDFWVEFIIPHKVFDWLLKSAEANAVWNKILAWQDTGDSLGVYMNLHNPHGGAQNVWLKLGNSQIGRDEALRLNRSIFGNLTGYTTKIDVTGIREETSPLNLLASAFKIYLVYEINMHASGRFLTLADFDSLGAAFAKGIYDYYDLGAVNNPSNQPPVALVKMDTTEVEVGVAVMLDGSASYDSDGDSLSYQWTQVFGPKGIWSDTTSPTPFFTPVAVGTYVLRLVVNDGVADSAPVFLILQATVVLNGDMNFDGKVSYDDFFLLAEAFGKASGEESFNPACDLDENGRIDFDDFFTFAENFGRS